MEKRTLKKPKYFVYWDFIRIHAIFHLLLSILLRVRPLFRVIMIFSLITHPSVVFIVALVAPMPFPVVYHLGLGFSGSRLLEHLGLNPLVLLGRFFRRVGFSIVVLGFSFLASSVPVIQMTFPDHCHKRNYLSMLWQQLVSSSFSSHVISWCSGHDLNMSCSLTKEYGTPQQSKRKR